MAEVGIVFEPGTEFLSGAGETGELIARRDWSETALGPIAAWPQSLKTATALLLRSAVPIVMLWGEDGIMLYNDAYSAFAGGRHPALLGSKVREGWPEVAAFNDHVMREGLAGRTLAYRDQELTLYRHGRPEQVWMDLDYSPVLDETGRPAGVLAIVVETTERVAAGRRAEAERQRQRQMLQQMPGLAAMLSGPQHRFEYVNDSYAEIAGRRHFVGRTVREVFPELEDQGVFERLDRVYRTGTPFAGRAIPVRLQRNDGERFLDLQYEPIRDDAGQVSGIFIGGYDVTDRVRDAQRRDALLRLDERLRDLSDPADLSFAASELLGAVLGAVRVGYGVIDAQAHTVTVERNWSAPGFSSVAGIHHLDDFGSHRVDLEGGRPVANADVTRDPRSAGRVPAYRALDVGAHLDVPVIENNVAVALVFVHAAEARAWNDREIALVREFAERTRAAISRRTAERALRELNETLEVRVAERTAALERAHEQLRQSQKMEAVGQLTGGLAHDFNNLLTGIIVSLDLLQRQAASGRFDQVDRYASVAMSSARRAGALTQRLLAFARRQPLDPRPIDVNRLVASMEELLRRTLGPAIALDLVLHPATRATLSDPNQLESAILNLAINARDAMPDGGRLTIETSNARLDPWDAPVRAREAEPGHYVLITVTDTGIGVPPDHLARIFEPFFTTKPIGQGTGLGLSQTYGFVKQSGGHVAVTSEPGRGATFRLFLPRHGADAAEVPLASAAVDSGPATRTGDVVLVVDDEDEIRTLVVEVLDGLGYAALQAVDGPTGLSSLQADGRIDLLVTDVGLPGLNGRQLADAARAVRPGLPVLFITGYAGAAAIGNSVLEPGMEILSKPFTIDQLVAKVHSLRNARG